MKRVLLTPIFNCPSDVFVGDNLAHYLPGKYLWHVCNVKKTGFSEPIYHANIQDEVSLSFAFFKHQPQHRYFKKPAWIDRFIEVEDETDCNRIAKEHDFFVNNYRYRGAHPPETNCGFSSDLKELNLYVPPITHKAVYEEKIYLDDLLLSDKYAEFVEEITREISPDGNPIIVLHNRGNDPWNRHRPFTILKYEWVLSELLHSFPNHIFVLAGESWKFPSHPRIKSLDRFVNADRCYERLGEHNACLQYILSSYFCRDADLICIGMSGFTLFIESIRPLNLSPPIPVFWNKEIFEGECTCVKLHQKLKGWNCPEFEKYKKDNSRDTAYQFGIHHFLYYSRDEQTLKSYCFDNPNTKEKIITMVHKIADQYNIKRQEMIKQKIKKMHRWYPLFIHALFLSLQSIRKFSGKVLRKLKKYFKINYNLRRT